MAADVVLGYLHGQQVDGAFHDSLVTTLTQDGFKRIAGVISNESGPILAPARNELAQAFMGTGAKWLLSLDADMVFPRDIVPRLLAHATGKRMVGALCFAYAKSGETWPTMYDENLEVIHDWAPGSLVPVGGTGAACLMIPRTVFQQVPYPWYADAAEDLYFCRKAREHGFEVAVDTSLVVGHAKRTIVGEAEYRRWQSKL